MISMLVECEAKKMFKIAFNRDRFNRKRVCCIKIIWKSVTSWHQQYQQLTCMEYDNLLLGIQSI